MFSNGKISWAAARIRQHPTFLKSKRILGAVCNILLMHFASVVNCVTEKITNLLVKWDYVPRIASKVAEFSNVKTRFRNLIN